jgi:hypothetical protein
MNKNFILFSRIRSANKAEALPLIAGISGDVEGFHRRTIKVEIEATI